MLTFIKSIAVLLVTIFALSIFFKGIGFFIVEYLKPSPNTMIILEIFVSILVTCVGFFCSAIIIGRKISVVASFVIPTLLLIVIFLLAINGPISFGLKTPWIAIIICTAFSFLASYSGALYGNTKERNHK
jgi:hypothetical protein